MDPQISGSMSEVASKNFMSATVTGQLPTYKVQRPALEQHLQALGV